MSKKLFSSKDIEILSKNKYVKKVSEKGITYTDEFKRLFIAENEKGKSYLFFKHGQKAYLSTILDASTNEILAYNISKSLKIDIVTDTIDKLIKNNSSLLRNDSFIHSDQGAHYTSPIFQKKVKTYNLGQSMSRRGNCWDNAPQESFFGHMKDEINYRSCTTFEELKGIIDNYINYYNNYRYQWNLKRLTPVKYRNQLLAA